MLDTLYSSNTAWGAEAITVADGHFGGRDQMRLQEAAVPGMALSYENSADGAKYLNVFKFGNASARPEFFGVLWTKGASPTMSTPATANNADGKFVVFKGYCPVLLAPGEVVRAGQYLEPIPTGTNQAMWRAVNGGGRGQAWSTQSYDNSAGSVGKWIGAVIEPISIGVGLVGAVGPSATLTGVAVETVFAASTIAIPAFSLRVGQVLRLRGSARGLNGAAGADVIKGYINGIGSTALFTSPSVTFSANDICRWEVDIVIVSLGAPGTMLVGGSVGFGAPGTATLRVQGGAGAVNIDTTVANLITIAATPNNAADQQRLEMNILERLN